MWEAWGGLGLEWHDEGLPGLWPWKAWVPCLGVFRCVLGTEGWLLESSCC